MRRMLFVKKKVSLREAARRLHHYFLSIERPPGGAFFARTRWLCEGAVNSIFK
jgi:hypothetical protein